MDKKIKDNLKYAERYYNKFYRINSKQLFFHNFIALQWVALFIINGKNVYSRRLI